MLISNTYGYDFSSHILWITSFDLYVSPLVSNYFLKSRYSLRCILCDFEESRSKPEFISNIINIIILKIVTLFFLIKFEKDL